MKKSIIEKYGVELEEYGTKKKDVCVSIFCLTYNHISFIENALKGFLMQRTTFPIEVFIIDDASTDGTSDVVIEYTRKYPKLFHAVIAKENTWRMEKRPNIIYELMKENLTGKYVAWCEGDDYWIYEYKLQRQFEFMESHPEVSLCMHNAIRYNASNGEVIPQIMNMDSGYENEDEIVFCLHGRVPTASYFWRNELIDYCAEIFIICPVGDEPIRIWLGYQGKVYYMDKVWSVRNYMHEGSWNYSMQADAEKKKEHNYRYLNFLYIIDRETQMCFHKQIHQWVIDICMLEVELLSDENMHEAKLLEKTNQLKSKYAHIFDDEFEEAFAVLKRNCIETMERLRSISEDSTKKLYIYGAGIQGEKAIQMFAEHQIAIDGVVVTERGHGNCDRYTVHAIDEVHSKPEDTYFYLALRRKYRGEVVEILRKKGYENIF